MLLLLDTAGGWGCSETPEEMYVYGNDMSPPPPRLKPGFFTPAPVLMMADDCTKN